MTEDRLTLSRRRLLQSCAGAALGAGIASVLPTGCTTGHREPSARPRSNIVFVQCDSMDGRIMGSLGHPAAHTPNLDRLAARGVLFRNTYCNNPICCPSRSSMWSGRYTFHCEGWNNYKGLEPNAPTFRTHLDAAGYLTETCGKTDYLSGAHSQRARVTAWTRSAGIRLPAYDMGKPSVAEGPGAEPHAGDWNTVARCVRFLEENRAISRPFCLYCGLNAPHPAFKTARKWYDLIDPGRVTIPAMDGEVHPVMEYMRLVKNWKHGFAPDMVREVRRVYFAMIAEVDAMVGRLLKAVDDLGLAGSTYFIFTSDHGEMAMEHQQYYKMCHYEPSVRVPLIVAGPGVRRGAAVGELASLVDIYPTLMDMAGVPQPQGLDGHSLMPDLVGAANPRPGWVLSEYHDSTACTGMFMLRKGDWKYMAFVGYEPMLFNLAEDPDEMHNLARSQSRKCKDMDTELRAIVDYEAVDARVKDYDKRSFRSWRDRVRAGAEPLEEDGPGAARKSYEEMMASIYQGWGPQWDRKIEEWLSRR